MSHDCLFDSRLQNGQGKVVKTLLTEDGCHYPIIAHNAYTDRRKLQSAPPSNVTHLRGSRPMHRTTLVLAKPPWVPDYDTTTKQYYGGSKTLQPVERPPMCPSLHLTQFHIGNPREPRDWQTNYCKNYPQKEIIPANRLHLTSLIHRIDQTEGASMKQVVKPTPGPQNYWTQYKRIHSKLGYLLGPGVPREYPIRQQYNFITGEMGAPAWSPDNKRVSGNRVLYSARSAEESCPIIR
ncbi:uncharacterized protein LOC121378873 [Gigantopelta aegis]|uniref:uncharacterized protein LOC121378873 n=1 Tax=Gigantopelta aegis TaxID=1735272 RepID=UPI001B8876D6|nr:uncharacterized protein LOC121378873 [Gigantopelta aegis]